MADSPNKVSIDLNSWTTRARSEWSEAEGLESEKPAAARCADSGHLKPCSTLIAAGESLKRPFKGNFSEAHQL